MKITKSQLKQIINEELHEGILDVFSGTSIKTILSIAGKIQKDIIFIKEAVKRLESYGEWEINRLLGHQGVQSKDFDHWQESATWYQRRLDTLISAGQGETEVHGGRAAKKLGWFEKLMGGDQKYVRDQIGKLRREVNEVYLRVRELLQGVDDTAADEVKRLAHQAFLNSPIRNQWAAVDKWAAEKAEYEMQKHISRKTGALASRAESISHDKLNQIIKEELEEVIKIGAGGITMSPPSEPAKEILKNLATKLAEVGDIDAMSEEEAMDVLDVVIDSMQEIFHLGGFGEQSPVEEKKDHPGQSCEQAHPGQEHEEWVGTIAEVSSEKQRRWACAQKDKPASKRAKSLSAVEAEEMCKSKVEAA